MNTLDLSMLTTARVHSLYVGDRLVLGGKPHRFRHRVSRVVNSTSYEIAEYVRPSRGYARHVRRQKATRRTGR